MIYIGQSKQKRVRSELYLRLPVTAYIAEMAFDSLGSMELPNLITTLTLLQLLWAFNDVIYKWLQKRTVKNQDIRPKNIFYWCYTVL